MNKNKKQSKKTILIILVIIICVILLDSGISFLLKKHPVLSYKETINEYRLEKISLPNDLENLEDTVDVKLFYQSTTKVNIPNTMKNGKKYIFGVLILLIGLVLILSTRIKNKEQ